MNNPRRDATVRVANLLAFTLTAEPMPELGVPESFVYLLIDPAAKGEPVDRFAVLAMLLASGLVARRPGPVLVPGPNWERIKADADKARETLRARGVAV